ncbi:MAG: hypothetical protein OXG44_10660 [Gammaproteobacteria bacterium]|nr:hypothetical protein [Gammaproteobacteria bacterium]
MTEKRADDLVAGDEVRGRGVVARTRTMGVYGRGAERTWTRVWYEGDGVPRDMNHAALCDVAAG